MKLTELKHPPLEDVLHKMEDFLHHMAEEELISCKVYTMNAEGQDTVLLVADCNDKPRQTGFQKDLSDKLAKRMKKHADVSWITPKVYHKNIDPR